MRARRSKKPSSRAPVAMLKMLDALLERERTQRSRLSNAHQGRPPLTLDDLLPLALRRLPSALDHDAQTQQRRPEEVVVAWFDGHSRIGQEGYRLVHGQGDGAPSVDANLASARASGEPWTWCAIGWSNVIAELLHDVGCLPPGLARAFDDWRGHESPHETVRVVLVADGSGGDFAETEIRCLAIERDRKKCVTALRVRTVGSSTVGPVSTRSADEGGGVLPAPVYVLGNGRAVRASVAAPKRLASSNESSHPNGETYRQEGTRCGKATCRCASGVTGDLHGPYWYAYRRDETGKVRKRYIGKSLDAKPRRASAPLAARRPVIDTVGEDVRSDEGAARPLAAPSPSRVKATVGAFRIKVALLGISPRVWRRFVVPASMRLTDLHDTIQIVMGWENAHLHQFQIGGMVYDDEGLGGGGSETVPLSVVLREGSIFHYLYDFGDRWEHRLVVEKALKTPRKAPQCLAGQWESPGEDSGGPLGYRPRKRKRDRFDLGAVNNELARAEQEGS